MQDANCLSMLTVNEWATPDRSYLSIEFKLNRKIDSYLMKRNRILTLPVYSN